MAGHGSKKVIYAAMIGNGLIAVTKFVAASITGSSAMLSEGIHSVVDTGNQVLLLYGMRRARKPADEEHPFGYGTELYFWAFVVAIMIFAVGAGVSIYEGISKIRHPHEITSQMINYVVLGLAMIFEAFAWWIAFKEFEAKRGKRGLFEEVRRSKDPTVFTVLFEDTAAMLGLIVAFIGIALVQYTGTLWLDGAASVVIGLILASTAAMLAYETKGLLIGEAAAPELVEGLREIIADIKAIDNLNEIRTMHQGPDDVLAAISLDFRDDLPAGSVEETIYRIEMAIKTRFPEVKQVFIEVQSKQHHEEILVAERAQEAEDNA